MTEFQDGKPGVIKIEYRPAGFFKNLPGKDAGAGVEIMYHEW
jgi:hypothetical protein